jgi:hypothetical protein
MAVGMAASLSLPSMLPALSDHLDAIESSPRTPLEQVWGSRGLGPAAAQPGGLSLPAAAGR